MRNLVWDRPSLARKTREDLRSRGFVAPDARDMDEETELAFHRVWLARELRKMPMPSHRDEVHLPTIAGEDVIHSIDGLRSACGLNPLPHRHTS